MVVVRIKAQPVSMRLPEPDLALIDRAAARRGRSRTDFMREASVRAAEETLMEPILLRVSQAFWEQLNADLDRPPELVPEIVRDLQRVPPWARKDADGSTD